MDKDKQPGIAFESVFLKHLNFSRGLNIPGNEIDISFSINNNVSPDKQRLICEFGAKVETKDDSFKIECTMVGIFTVIPGEENMDIENFKDSNAPSLIFPYVREILTSTTIKAGLAPLILPPLNVVQMVKH